MTQIKAEDVEAREVVQTLGAMTTRLEKYEERIRSLEDDRVRIKAWAALIVFAGSIAAFFVGKFWPI